MGQKTGIEGICCGCGKTKKIAAKDRCWKCYEAWRKETGQPAGPPRKRRKATVSGAEKVIHRQGPAKTEDVDFNMRDEVQEITQGVKRIVDKCKSLSQAFTELRLELIQSRAELRKLKEFVKSSEQEVEPKEK